MPSDPLASVRKELDKRLSAAAMLLRSEHKGDLGKPALPHSKPGEFPRAMTFTLWDSVIVVPISGGYRVGYDAKKVGSYLPVLAKRGRLTVRDTAARVAARMAKVIGG